MRISSIAFANLKRRKGKALFLIVGIAIGIGTAIALVTLSASITEEIGTQLDRFGANIVVVPQANSLSLDYGGVSVSSVSFDVQQLRDEDAKNVRDIPYKERLSIISPKLLGAVKIADQEVLLAGVDFKSELLLKSWWQITGEEPQGERDVLVGYEAARALSLIESTGEMATQKPMNHAQMDSTSPSLEAEPFKIIQPRLLIAGSEHRVAGVLAPTGAPDDRMVFAPLTQVQAMLKKPGELSVIEVSALCKDCPVADIVAQIAERLPQARVSAIQQSVRARTATVERLTRFATVVAALVLVIAALMIFTSMTASILERTKEIGVLRAIGFRKSHIIKSLLIEVGVISVIGGLLGWAAGMLASVIALPYFAETQIAIPIRAELLVGALGAGLLVGILSSLYPIISAARRDPAESVRAI
ncbi:MAG: ABC transporter permease [Acidobacteria bacterium]|nr:ABC transporter permease [Acidobacteriota bacterium]